MLWLMKMMRLIGPAKPIHHRSQFEGAGGQAKIISILKENLSVAGDDALARELFRCGRLCSFEKGDDLIIQGASDSEAYFLLFGETNIIIDGNERAVRAAPNQVGEMSALDHSAPRSATVRAKTDTVFAWVISADQFQDIINRNPLFLAGIRREITKRFRENMSSRIQNGWKDLTMWTALSIGVAFTGGLIAFFTFSYAPIGEIEQTLLTGGTTLLLLIFMVFYNPAFFWRRMIGFIVFALVSLFVLDRTITAKIMNGNEVTQYSMTSSGIDLDWAIILAIAIPLSALATILALFEHRRQTL